jgi:hypothetical protein
MSFSEKEKKFLDWFNKQKLKNLGKEGKFKTLSSDAKKNLKKVFEIGYSGEELNYAFLNMCKNKWALENDQINPSHFLRINNLEKYINSDGKQKSSETRTDGQNNAVEQFRQRIVSSVNK